MILRELITKFGFDVDSDKVKKIDNSINGLKNRMEGLAQKSTQLGRRLTTFVTLPILAMGAGMVKAASDAEETESKFATVFGGIADKSEQAAKDLSKNFGLGSTEAKQLLGDTGDLLTGFGFTQEKALELANGVQELAVDLASFTNFSGGANGASRALTKALLGERESVKLLGISILEEDVKRKAALLTSQGMVFETERQAKAFATLMIAQEQSKNAIGDYARTSDQFANRFRFMQKTVRGVAESFGKILLPPALKLLDLFIKLLEFVEGLSDSTKTFILILAGVVALLGPLLLLLGFTLTLVISLTAGFMGLAATLGITNAALAIMIGEFLLMGIAIAAGLAIVFLVVDDLIAFFSGDDSLTGVIISQIGKAIDFVSEKFNGLPGIVRLAMASALTPIRAAVALVRALGGALGALSGGDFGGALDALKEGVVDTLNLKAAASNGVGGLLGFGPSSQTTNGNTTNTANAEVTVNVPAGTDPEEAGQFVRQGVTEGLFDIFQETQRQVVSPISE